MVGTPTKLFPKQGISVDNEGKRAFPASSNENLDHGVTASLVAKLVVSTPKCSLWETLSGKILAGGRILAQVGRTLADIVGTSADSDLHRRPFSTTTAVIVMCPPRSILFD
jgi:hypothetical protein